MAIISKRLGFHPLSGIVFLLAIATLSGCAMARPKPYVRPPAGTSLEERERIYANKEVRRNGWGHPSVDGHYVPHAVLDGYYDASGDTVAAATVRRTNYFVQVAALLTEAGLGYCLGLEQGSYWSGGDQSVGNQASDAVLGVAGGFLLFQLWAEQFVYPRAARSYNRYLAQDLGLDAAALQAAQQLPPPARRRRARVPVAEPADETPTAAPQP